MVSESVASYRCPEVFGCAAAAVTLMARDFGDVLRAGCGSVGMGDVLRLGGGSGQTTRLQSALLLLSLGYSSGSSASRAGWRIQVQSLQLVVAVVILENGTPERGRSPLRWRECVRK